VVENGLSGGRPGAGERVPSLIFGDRICTTPLQEAEALSQTFCANKTKVHTALFQPCLGKSRRPVLETHFSNGARGRAKARGLGDREGDGSRRYSGLPSQELCREPSSTSAQALSLASPHWYFCWDMAHWERWAGLQCWRARLARQLSPRFFLHLHCMQRHGTVSL
jgi:hypothetical protein